MSSVPFAVVAARAHLVTTNGNLLLPRPARNERGEGWGEGVSSRLGLLSPILSSCRGGEGADLLWPLGGCNKMRPRIEQFEF